MNNDREEIKEKIISDLFKNVLEKGYFTKPVWVPRNNGPRVWGYKFYTEIKNVNISLMVAHSSLDGSGDENYSLIVNNPHVFLIGVEQLSKNMVFKKDTSLATIHVERADNIACRILKKDVIIEYIEKMLGANINRIEHEKKDRVYAL